MATDQIAQIDTQGADEVPRPGRGFRKWTARTTIAAGVAAALVIAGSTAYGVDRHNQQVQAKQVAAATATHDTAVNDLSSARTDYMKALAAARAAVASNTADTLSDPATLTALQKVIADSEPLLKQLSAFGLGKVPAKSQVSDINAITSSAATLKGQVADAIKQVTAATKAVTDSHATFLLNQAGQAFDAAVANLNAQLGASQGVLDGSSGKVSDDAVRQALSASMDAAKQAVNVTKADTADAINAQIKPIIDAKADLASKTQAVSDAQAAWQSAQDAAAAAAAAAQAQAAQAAPSGSTKSGTTARSGTTTKSGSTTTRSSSGATSSGTSSSGSTGGTTSGGTAPSAPSGQQSVNAPQLSTPGEAIAGVTAARAAAGLQTVSSCSSIPGSVQAGVGIVHAITWDSWLSSPDHRAIIMVPKPAVLSAWNAVSGTGTQAIYMQVWACAVPS